MPDNTSHNCIKEAEIAEIHTDLKNIKRVVMGNGREGLNTTVPVLAEQVKDLRVELSEDREVRQQIKTSLSGVLKFQEEEQARRQIEKEESHHYDKKRNRQVMIYMAVIATISLGFTLLINFL